MNQKSVIKNRKNRETFFSTGLITAAALALLILFSFSGCSAVAGRGADKIKADKSAEVEQKAEKKDENLSGITDLNGDDERFESATEDDEAERDFSGAAYYYYVKSERHRQKGEINSAIDAALKAIETDPESVFLKKDLIFLYLLNKDAENAAKTAKETLQEHPDNEDLLVILAKLKLQSNDLREAKDIYDRILKINPKNHDAYIVLGNIYLENKQIDEAFWLFSKMASVFPESYASHFFMGKIYMEKKNIAQAEKEFKKSIAVKPDLVESRFELIKIYKQQKNSTQKVMNLYTEILKLDRNNLKATIELPIFMYRKGDKAKASAMMVEFGRKYMQNEAMMTAIAKELVNNRSSEEAEILFTQMMKSDPDNASMNYLAGLTFDSLKESRKAIDHFMKVSSGTEQYKKAIFHIAYLYNQMEKSDMAIRFLESKRAEMPEDTELLSYLSVFYEDVGDLEKATSLLQKGLDISPEDTELLFRLGVIQDKKGDKEGCIESMKKIIDIDPEHASALNYLGYTYAELGINLDTAEELVNRSLKIKPDDGFITDSLGWVYYKKGLFDRAVAVLEKAFTLSSGDPTITEHLGDAYRENKMFEKAIDAYKKALQKSQTPENRAILEKKINDIIKMKK